MKTKIKSCGDQAVDIRDKEIHKVGSNYTCLVVILIDILLEKSENYNLKVI